MWPMVATQFLKARVSVEEKQRVQVMAGRDLVTESVWLKRLVMAALRDSQRDSHSMDDSAPKAWEEARQGPRDARCYVRLRPEDWLLLRARAAARGMPGATYISVLVRAHLRSLPPMPKDELAALKRSVAELGAIGRNLNQLARAANQSSRVVGPSHDDLRTFLKVCEGLRDHVKALIRANLESWAVGHAETSN
jgi:predicted DNA binding CopG/RHH family protein